MTEAVASISCELRGVSVEDAMSSVHWQPAKPYLRQRFDELWPGRAVNETLTQEHRKLGNGRTELVAVIDWAPV